MFLRDCEMCVILLFVVKTLVNGLSRFDDLPVILLVAYLHCILTKTVKFTQLFQRKNDAKNGKKMENNAKNGKKRYDRTESDSDLIRFRLENFVR